MLSRHDHWRGRSAHVASRRAAVIAAGAALLLCDEALASGARGPASTLGVLMLAGPLLLLRESPGGLIGSAWVMGTLLAGVVWLCRTHPIPAWFARSAATVVRLRRPGIPSSAIGPPNTEERPAVLDAARRCFVELQAAWDLRDATALRARTTPEMYAELLTELDRRAGAPDRTDVVTLDAELLALECIGTREVASVAFSGMIRESADAGAAPFREVWMLVRDAGADWRLARHQTLL
jgi:hypothetical protein